MKPTMRVLDSLRTMTSQLMEGSPLITKLPISKEVRAKLLIGKSLMKNSKVGTMNILDMKNLLWCSKLVFILSI